MGRGSGTSLKGSQGRYTPAKSLWFCAELLPSRVQRVASPRVNELVASQGQRQAKMLNVDVTLIDASYCFLYSAVCLLALSCLREFVLLARHPIEQN